MKSTNRKHKVDKNKKKLNIPTIERNLTLDVFCAYYSDVRTNPKNKRGKLVKQKNMESMLNTLMKECGRLQNKYMKYFSKKKYRDFIFSLPTHPNKEQREVFKEVDQISKKNWKSNHHWTKGCIEEAVAKLKGYHKRQRIAEVLVKNPEMTLNEVKVKLNDKYIKHNLYKNVKRAIDNTGAKLEIPATNRPRLNIGADTNLVLELFEDGILIKKLHIKEYTLDVFFPINVDHMKKFKNLTNIGYPTIRIKNNGDYVFDFLITSQVKTPKNQSNYLGIDPKMNNGFAAAIVYSNGSISKEIKPSKETLRHQKKIDRLKLDRKNKKTRLKNKLQSYSKLSEEEQIKKTQYLIDEINSISDKIKRINTALDWSAANDVVHLAKQTNSTICLEEVKFNDGDNHWRNSLFFEKVQHTAKAYGISLKGINPKNTSKTCPNCGAKLEDKTLEERTSRCPSCKEEGDRDYFAAIIMAKKGRGIRKKVDFRKTKNKKQIVKRVKEINEKKSMMIKWACLRWASSALKCYQVGNYIDSCKVPVKTGNTSFSCEVQAT